MSLISIALRKVEYSSFSFIAFDWAIYTSLFKIYSSSFAFPIFRIYSLAFVSFVVISDSS